MEKLEVKISELQELFKKQDAIRIAFSGGIGIDGFLGSLTRGHDDIDIEAFGNLERKDGIKKLEEIISSYDPRFNGTYYEFQSDGIKIEVGYIQILEEDSGEYIYDAGDGRFTISKPLFEMNRGKLGENTFNISNPLYTVAEKIMVPILGIKEYRQKDFVDLNNLLKKLELKDVQTALFERYKFENGGFKDIGMP